MDKEMLELTETACLDVIFNSKYNVCDHLLILNWVQDHRPCKVYRSRSRYLTLNYCGRCSTIVGEGDRYCSQCGRELIWND